MVLLLLLFRFAFIKGNVSTGLLYKQEAVPGSLKMGWDAEDHVC